MCSPPLAGGTRSSPTSTLPSVPALLLQERLRHPSSHARTPEHGRLAQLWLRSTAVERRGRSLPHRPRTRRRRGLRPPRRAGRRRRPARLDLLHRFHRREDDARRPRRVERLRSNRRRVLPRLRLYDRLDRAKIPIAAEFTESKQAPEETAMRVTCDALAVEKPIWMLGDSAYDTLGWHDHLLAAGGRASRSVQRTKHRRSERHRVQGRSPHRRTQRGRSAEAIDARRDVQPPEWSRTNQRRRQGLRPRARSRPRPRPRTHEHKCSSRCAFVSLLRSPTTNAETIQEAPSSRYENYSMTPSTLV